MSVAPIGVAGLIGTDLAIVVRVIGVGLVGFAALLMYLCLVARRPWLMALGVSIADFGWVAATLALAIATPGALSAQGWLIASAVALVVLACGVAQSIGIDRSFRHPEPDREGWLTLGLGFRVHADAPSMWPVVREVGAIDTYAASLADASIVESCGEHGGPVRECRDTRGKSWREALEIDDARMRIDAVFLADRPGFPFPFRRMEGGWTVAPAPAGSVVHIWWDVKPKRRWTAFVLLPLLLTLLRPGMHRTIDAMRGAAIAEPGTREGTAEPDAAVVHADV